MIKDLIDDIDLNIINNLINRWNFKTGGCCVAVAKHIGAQLSEKGNFIESAYYDLLEDDEKQKIEYVYDVRHTCIGDNIKIIPHSCLHIFNTDLDFKGIIDIPANLYERIVIEELDIVKFKEKENRKPIEKSDIIFVEFHEQIDTIKYYSNGYNSLSYYDFMGKEG